MLPRRSGAPGRNRTCNRRLRRPVLYPVELRAPYESTSYSAKRNLSGRLSGPEQTESEVRADYIGVSWYLKRPIGSLTTRPTSASGPDLALNFQRRASVSQARGPIVEQSLPMIAVPRPIERVRIPTAVRVQL